LQAKAAQCALPSTGSADAEGSGQPDDCAKTSLQRSQI